MHTPHLHADVARVRMQSTRPERDVVRARQPSHKSTRLLPKPESPADALPADALESLFAQCSFLHSY